MQKGNRLATLREQRDQLEAKIKKLQGQARAQERKQDTRRKILLGSYMLAEAGRQGRDLLALGKMLDSHLKRPSDRRLFGLE